MKFKMILSSNNNNNNKVRHQLMNTSCTTASSFKNIIYDETNDECF